MIGNSGLIRPLQIDCELGAKAVKLRSPVTPQVRLTGSVCFVRGPAMDVRRSFYLMPRSKSVAVAQMYDGEAVWPDGTLRQAIKAYFAMR